MRICVKVTHSVVEGSVRVHTVCGVRGDRRALRCASVDTGVQGRHSEPGRRDVCVRAKHGHASEAGNFGI